MPQDRLEITRWYWRWQKLSERIREALNEGKGIILESMKIEKVVEMCDKNKFKSLKKTL